MPRVMETVLATMKVILGRTKAKADQRNACSANKEGKPRPQELQLIQSLDVIVQPPSSCSALEVNASGQ